jgi:hypothetical protein
MVASSAEAGGPNFAEWGQGEGKPQFELALNLLAACDLKCPSSKGWASVPRSGRFGVIVESLRGQGPSFSLDAI